MPNQKTKVNFRFLSISALLSFTCLGQIKNGRQELIGNWKVDQRYVLCNVCSEVEFKNNLTGILQSGGASPVEFKWKVTDSILSLRFKATKKSERQILESGKYTIRFDADENPKAIHIIPIDGKSTYVLSPL